MHYHNFNVANVPKNGLEDYLPRTATYVLFVIVI